MESIIAAACGETPCAWQMQCSQMQDALVLARYEAQRWKEKYQHERQRRRDIARTLLDTMVVIEEARSAAAARHADENGGGGPPLRASRTRRSSSTFSELNHIESLLSPTLSSFDFDDDEEEEEEEGEEERAVKQQQEEAEDADEVAEAADADLGPRRRSGQLETPDSQASQPTPTVEAAAETSGAGRPSLMLQRPDVRPARSSTIGSCDVSRVSRVGSWRRGFDTRTGMSGSATMPPSGLLYRMLYAKSSSRDLWTTQTQASRFQSVARSIVFSMQLRKEHIFEHFFIAGVAVGQRECDRAAAGLSKLSGFWKPSVLFEYPERPGKTPDSSVAEFCFPAGVPVVKCKPHQVASIKGAPISIWSTDLEALQKHILDPFRTSGYTFRLTGAKGEVLYGFCVSIMMDVIVCDDRSTTPLSPRNDWTKRASCPNGSLLQTNGGSYQESENQSKLNTATYVAPVCFCLTSKFPFYRLHFSVLRMLVENELAHKQHYALRAGKEYDVTLTVESSLGVEFAACRQPALGFKGALDDHRAHNLSSVASNPHRNREGHVVLSEEDPCYPNSVDSNLVESPTSRSPLHKRSYSSDDAGWFTTNSTCVVEKPVVVRVTSPQSPRTSQIRVGDILEAIDGLSTASMSFAEATRLLKDSPRPLKLRLRHFDSSTTGSTRSAPIPNTPIPTSLDILHRYRGVKIGDPNQWAAIRFPNSVMDYQFPKRHAERWAIGVALRWLTPVDVVKILALLLLEKQVAIMGESSAKVSAVCTAFLLLLSPFQWQSTYIPQLPTSLLDFLHSPVPFIVGCQRLDSTDEWPEVTFYDIDENIVMAPISDHHIGPSSLPHGAELCRLFEGAKERFNRIRSITKPWHDLSDEEDKVITLTMQEAKLFLQDICGELTAIQLASTVDDGKSFYERLQDQMGSIVRKSSHEDFLEEFSQTQMFCQYCETTLQQAPGKPVATKGVE